jgi:hypothetical protein
MSFVAMFAALTFVKVFHWLVQVIKKKEGLAAVCVEFRTTLHAAAAREACGHTVAHQPPPKKGSLNTTFLTSNA